MSSVPDHSVLRLVRDADTRAATPTGAPPRRDTPGDQPFAPGLPPEALRTRLSAGRVNPISEQAKGERAAVLSIGQAVRRHAPSAPATPSRGIRADRSCLALDTGESGSLGFVTGTGSGRESVGAAGPRAARREVARENLLASALPAMDTRWMLALKVQHALEGGVAAMLRPEVRRRLVADARHMGLRPFDANLVIAIVQDRARAGLAIGGPETDVRLAMVGVPGPRGQNTQNVQALRLLLLAASIGLLVGAYVVNWILSAR